jgi:RNA polymerase sigma factor (sigma-70 family)
MTRNDMVSWGNIGLREAVLKFDPKFGNKFSTYARYWIIKEVRKALATKGNSSGFLSMPASAVSKVNKIKTARWEYITENGEEPSNETLSEMTNLSVGSIESLLPMCEWQRTQVDYMDHNDYSTQPSSEEVSDEIGHMRRAMTLLAPIEAGVLILREGLCDGNTHNLEKVSQKIGKTRERVRQIQNEAKEKLNKIMARGVDTSVQEINYKKAIEEMVQ